MFFEKMKRFMSDEAPRHYGRCCDRDESRFLAERKGRYLLFVVSGWPLAGDDAVFPSVPRAFDVFASDSPLAKRASLMVAAISDRVQLSLVEKDRNRMLFDVDRERRPRSDLVTVAEDVPGLIGIHMLSGLKAGLI